MPKIKVVILQNEDPDDSLLWIKSCKKRNDIEFAVVDLTKNDWLKRAIPMVSFQNPSDETVMWPVTPRDTASS